MKTLVKRLRRLEDSLAQRIAATQGFNAKQILAERIEAMAARLRAGGSAIPENGPLADAARLHVEQWLARLRAAGSFRVGGARSAERYEGDHHTVTTA